nr:retrovirus-related Pol polyprotein from transposon TNT 1-94 [Tanacetum cinerariifolium]
MQEADNCSHITTEAEYVVAVSCCGQVIWIQNQLLDYGKPQDHCSTEVLEDSRNPNPTASTSSLPADQKKTLTVKTPIPT